MSGNTLSYAYSVEWPIFAVIAVIGWWQLIHEDPAEVVARKVEGNVRVLLDWRGALAAGAALGIAIALISRRKHD